MCVYVQIRCSLCSLILWCDFGCTFTDENIRSCSDFEVLERSRPSKVNCERKTAVRFQCGQACFTAPWWPVPEVIKLFYLWINEAKKAFFCWYRSFFPLLLLICLYWTKMLSFSSHFLHEASVVMHPYHIFRKSFSSEGTWVGLSSALEGMEKIRRVSSKQVVRRLAQTNKWRSHLAWIWFQLFKTLMFCLDPQRTHWSTIKWVLKTFLRLFSTPMSINLS